MSNAERESLSVADVVERYPAFREEPLMTLAEHADAATVVRGNYETDAASLVQIAVDEGEEGTVIVVDGDLTLTAPRVEWGGEEFSNNVLLVTGNLKARGLYLSEVGAVRVQGNLTARAVVGCYGDNGGSLDVDGDLEADVVVAQTYFCFGIQGEARVGVIVGDSTYATDWVEEGGYIEDERVELFVPEVCDGGEADAELLLKRAVAGLPVLVNDGKPREGVYEEQM